MILWAFMASFFAYLASAEFSTSKYPLALTRAISYMVECSEQGWNNDISKWCGNSMDKLRLEGSFRLSYNGSLFVKERLGYLLTFEHLIDTNPGSRLVFRPLTPTLETKMYLIWKKYQVFTPIAERLLGSLKSCFESMAAGHDALTPDSIVKKE